MKKTLLIILLLFPFNCFALTSAMQALMSGVYNPCYGYLLCQNFETATTGFDNGEKWYEKTCDGNGVFTPNDSTSPSPLRGTQSLRMATGTTGNSCDALGGITARDTVYERFIFRPVTLANANAIITILKNAGYTQQLNVGIQYVSSNTFKFYLEDGTVSATTSNITNFTSSAYTIWVKFVKGTGSNAVYELSYAVGSTTKPESPQISITDGVINTQIDKIYAIIQSTSHEETVIYDQILVKATDIGSGDVP